ncbi:copper amine oxidase N-terminal domain-containing protein [Tepidanaerobacter sp. EBM-38]|jgi:hypothetical protein|uniref:copper amine oxidase N-terminal domain-containing protein n=2 Tax=Tepidanaerobacter TaxID=499228 RepID=UPI000B06B861|nr:copper amine oxidase N-terminal domain-containing protein [Tepidanaerobacter sp. EBM-38]
MTVKLTRFFAMVLILLIGLTGFSGTAQAQTDIIDDKSSVPIEKIELEIVLKIDDNQAFINGMPMLLDVPAMLHKDRTLVPIRFIAEAMGANVEYEHSEQKVTISSKEERELEIVLKIGDNQAFVNGVPMFLDVPAMLHKDRTLVPIRFIAEAMGANVEYEHSEQKVTIQLTSRSPFADNISKMEDANKVFRAETKKIMHEVARQEKIELADIGPINVVAVNNPDAKIISTAVEGVDTLTIEQLAKGSDVLFTFVQLPDGSEIPSGFYVIHVLGDPKANKWAAQFRNLDGKVVLETSAEVESRASAESGKAAAPAGVKTDISITISGSSVEFNFEGEWSIFIKTFLKIGQNGPDSTPLPDAGERIVKAAEDFTFTINDSLVQASKETGKDMLDGWMSISGGDDELFAAFTAYEDVTKLTMEQLAEGQDILFGYFRTPEDSKLLADFYNIRIVEESGRWVGQFIDHKGKVIYQGLADVKEGELQLKKKVELSAELESGEGTTTFTGDVHIGKLNIEFTIKWVRKPKP